MAKGSEKGKPTPTPSPSATEPPARITPPANPYIENAEKGNKDKNETQFSSNGNIPFELKPENKGMAFIPNFDQYIPIPGELRRDAGRAGGPTPGNPNNPFYNQWASKADASDLFSDLPDWQQNMFANMAAAKGGNTTAESIYKKYVTKSATRSKVGVVATPGELAYEDISSGRAAYSTDGSGPSTSGSGRAYSGPVSTVTQLGDEDIRRMANDEAMSLIGRDVTDVEFKKIMTAVRRAEARNPSVSGGKGASRTSMSGLSAETRAEIIRDKTAGFIAKDVALANEATIYGEASKTMNDLRSWAQANGVTLTDNSIRQYTQQVIKGDRTADDIKADLRRTYVAGSYPAWSERINAGEDIADIAAPYRQTMATLLEVNDGDINLNDNTLRSALQGVGADGKPAIVPIYQFEKQVRKDPRWQYTNNAQADYSRAATEILNMFGLR